MAKIWSKLCLKYGQNMAQIWSKLWHKYGQNYGSNAAKNMAPATMSSHHTADSPTASLTL